MAHVTAEEEAALNEVIQLTHDQVKRFSDKDVQKYSKRYEAYIGNKTTDSLIDSAIMLFSKALAWLFRLMMRRDCRKNSRMTTSLTRSCHPLLEALHFDAADGWRWPMLLLSAHIKFEKEYENDAPPPTLPTHRSRASEGYPLEGFDEVDNLAGN